MAVYFPALGVLTLLPNGWDGKINFIVSGLNINVNFWNANLKTQ